MDGIRDEKLVRYLKRKRASLIRRNVELQVLF
jgi:hypothetical protein